MYASREIRWFTQNENQQISAWFSGKHCTFSDASPRTDFYLPIPGRNDLAIKLRETNVEIKQRRGDGQPGQPGNHATGFFENWEKWSFSANQHDQLAREITRDNKYGWTAVQKQRMALKLKEESPGKIRFTDIKEQIDYGCQVEYTRLVIADAEWYTFALEWFGEKTLVVDRSLFNEMTGHALLRAEDSMGYNEFLNKISGT